MILLLGFLTLLCTTTRAQDAKLQLSLGASSGEIDVSWTIDGDYQATRYIITAAVPARGVYAIQEILDQSASSYTVQSLSPKTEYVVCVVSYSNADGILSECEQTMTTDSSKAVLIAVLIVVAVLLLIVIVGSVHYFVIRKRLQKKKTGNGAGEPPIHYNDFDLNATEVINEEGKHQSQQNEAFQDEHDPKATVAEPEEEDNEEGGYTRAKVVDQQNDASQPSSIPYVIPVPPKEPEDKSGSEDTTPVTERKQPAYNPAFDDSTTYQEGGYEEIKNVPRPKRYDSEV